MAEGGLLIVMYARDSGVENIGRFHALGFCVECRRGTELGKPACRF